MKGCGLGCGVITMNLQLLSSFRRDLMKLIGVREFSLEAKFRDPCQSFVLPEVSVVRGEPFL